MGKTVESYRIVLKQKISRWNGFARALRKEYREALDEPMDMCRIFTGCRKGSLALFKIGLETCGIDEKIRGVSRLRELSAHKRNIFWSSYRVREGS
jgi:hypothetical protein